MNAFEPPHLYRAYNGLGCEAGDGKLSPLLKTLLSVAGAGDYPSRSELLRAAAIVAASVGAGAGETIGAAGQRRADYRARQRRSIGSLFGRSSTTVRAVAFFCR